MGTRADFYVGLGKDAEWIGSIALDGYPEGVPQRLLSASSEKEFRQAFVELLGNRADVSTPKDGWPWPWDNSAETDFAYAFDMDNVLVAQFGRGWCPYKDQECDFDIFPVQQFPDMSDVKKVTFGPRSGLMVIGRVSE